MRGLIIFDWDGTLVDSVGLIVESMQVAARDLGLVVSSDDAVRGIIGLELGQAIATLYPELSTGDLALMRERYVERYLERDSDGSRFFEGIIPILDRLQANQVPMAVATGKSRRGLTRSMRQLDADKWFSFTRCADETQGKPHPAMVFDICQSSGIDPRDACVVGDTTFDLEMARRARSKAFGVAWGAHPESLLRSYAEYPCLTVRDDLCQNLLSTLGKM